VIFHRFFYVSQRLPLKKPGDFERKQCQLPADTAVDFHDGHDLLSAKDTPRSRGWLERNEVRKFFRQVDGSKFGFQWFIWFSDVLGC